MRNPSFAYLLAFILLVIISIISLSIGTSSLGPQEILHDLFSSETKGYAILHVVRIPHLIYSLLIGATLGLGGAVFQTLFRNPLADPYILGVSGGAALGATLSIAVFGSLAWIGAGMGAFGVIFLIAAIAGWTNGRHATYVILLAGVMINAFCGALILGIRSIISAQKSQEILFYLVGTLSAVENLETIDIMIATFATLIFLGGTLFFSKDLDLLLLGEKEALALGGHPERTRKILIVISSIAIAVAVSFTGLIGFVGLVAPHAIRIWIGPRHRHLLLLSAFLGALFLSFADILSRLSFHAFDTMLPVGAVTAILGAPVFLVFLKTQLRDQHA